MIVMLTLLSAVGIYRQGNLEGFLQLLSAGLTAIVLDFVIQYLKYGNKSFPKSALISGLIVGLVFSAGTDFIIIFIAAVVAILSKHVLQLKKQHIFNPAGFGLLATGLIFGGQFAWWGESSTILVILLGLVVAYSFNRLGLVISYLAVKALLVALYFFWMGWPVWNGILMLNLFFAFVMVVEPRTSPYRPNTRIVYGGLAAITTFLFLVFLPGYYPPLAGLLAANLFVPLLRRYHRKLKLPVVFL